MALTSTCSTRTSPHRVCPRSSSTCSRSGGRVQSRTNSEPSQVVCSQMHGSTHALLPGNLDLKSRGVRCVLDGKQARACVQAAIWKAEDASVLRLLHAVASDSRVGSPEGLKNSGRPLRQAMARSYLVCARSLQLTSVLTLLGLTSNSSSPVPEVSDVSGSSSKLGLLWLWLRRPSLDSSLSPLHGLGRRVAVVSYCLGPPSRRATNSRVHRVLLRCLGLC